MATTRLMTLSRHGGTYADVLSRCARTNIPTYSLIGLPADKALVAYPVVCGLPLAGGIMYFELYLDDTLVHDARYYAARYLVGNEYPVSNRIGVLGWNSGPLQLMSRDTSQPSNSLATYFDVWGGMNWQPPRVPAVCPRLKPLTYGSPRVIYAE